MATKTYDPTKIVVQLNGLAIGGFAPDTFIEATFNTAQFHTVPGCEGEATRTMSLDRTGTVKITLLSTSDSNAILADFAASDRTDGSGVFDLMIKDASGILQAHAPKAWIAKVPGLIAGTSVKEREWVIAVQVLELIDVEASFVPTLSGLVDVAIEGAKQLIAPILPQF
jgi:hypothetical protein